MPENRTLLRRLGSLPILLALFYIVFMTPLMGRKNGYTVDATPSYQLAKTIALTGDWFPDNLRVKQGYLYSIVYMPFYWLGDAIAGWNPGVEADWIRRKTMCWMNTVIAGFTLAILSALIRRLGYSRLAQIAVPAIYGLSTMAFNYARYDYNKALAAFLLLGAFYASIRFIQQKDLRSVMLCGTATMLLLAVRLEMAAAALALGTGFVLAPGTNREKFQRAVYYSLFCLAGIGWVLFYNRLYWSGEVAGGYEEGFQANPLPGLIGFLASPGKNLWVFNPALLLVPLSLRTFRNQNKDGFTVWLGATLAVFGLYCFWGNWWGGWAWGPRHLVPLLPLLVLPLASVVDSDDRLSKILLCGLAFAGVIIQGLGAAIDFNDVIMALARNQISEQELIWSPAWNAIFQHQIVLGYRSFALWDFGWLGAIHYFSLPVFLCLFAAWATALAGLGYAILRPTSEESFLRSTEP